MGEFRVHHLRFFDYIPKAIHCLAYNEDSQKLALSRSDGSIEIWSIKDNWYQEQVMSPEDGGSVEGLVWCQNKLFSAGLHGNLHEHDLLTGTVKSTTSSNSGAIWCLALNDSKTQIAAGSEDGCVVVFTVSEEGALYEKAFDKQESRILSIAWLSSENVIVTGGIDNIRVWSSTSGHAIQRLTLGRQEHNKETIVWTVAITKDFTIVSGDSRGKTCFWNGRQGTLLKSGNCVYSSGIDPTLVQFQYVAVQSKSDWKMWVKSRCRYQHSHDVHAIAITSDGIVSAGVDCQLIVNSLDECKKRNKWRRIAAIPSAPLAYTAHSANSVMLRYTDYLELWKLGATNAHSHKNGELLQLSKNPVKLLELKSKGEEQICCAAISSEADWIAYSDQQSEDNDIGAPKVEVNRVRFLPPGILPSRCLKFTVCGTMLISATQHGSIQMIKMDALHPQLLHTFAPLSEPAVGIHLLSISPDGDYFATGGHSNQVHVYSVKEQMHICSLPEYTCQPTAIGFHPTVPQVAVAYTDRKIVEYNFTQREYTPWCRKISQKWHTHWVKRRANVTQLFYNPHKPCQIFVRDELSFTIIDKQQPLPGPNDELFAQLNPADSQKEQHGFHVCNKFRFLLHLDVLEDDFMLLVERTPLSILETLPPPLKRNKFGV